MTSRRNFIKLSCALGLAPSLVNLVEPEEVYSESSLTNHKLPKPDYKYNALEPYIDRETMEIHHTKHHQGYINGLNKAEKELRKARIAGDYSLIQYWTKKASFNGGGHFLHSLFWKTMGPKSKVRREPNGKLMRLIKDKFGSFKDFKEQFTETAKSVEGSGWGLLHYRKIDESLLILQAENQNKLSPWGSTPILGIDVWEHAYYLKYKNKRADYIENWWNVVNWEQVEDNLEALL